MGKKHAEEHKPSKTKTPTNLVELPLFADAGQAARVRAHLEVGREFYNAVLSAGQQRLRRMRADPGMRFVIEKEDQRRPQGYLLCHDDRLRALIDWDDPVVAHGLAHEIKYARLVRRRASGPRAHGADSEGKRYVVQLVLTGLPHHKPKHTVGTDTSGLDLGPASLAIVPRQAEANLVKLGPELRPDTRAIGRLQRKMERQRRAANPEHYDERGRPKKRGKGAPRWKESRSYQASRPCKLAAHRKSLHGRLAHQIVAVGHTIVTEKISYRGWQKRYGRSVGLHAPGMLIDHLRRTGVSHGRHPA